MSITHHVHAIHRMAIHIYDSKGITNKMSLLKEEGKYLTSHISMLSKSIEARPDLDLFLNFVNFNASPILIIVDEG